MDTVETVAGVLAFIIDAMASVMNFLAPVIEWIVKTVGGIDFGGIFDSISGFFGGLFG